jgi:hypothetical protein
MHLYKGFHYKIKKNDINSIGKEYPGIGSFPMIFFGLFLHYFPRDKRLAKSLKAPGTPAGNCLKKLKPVYTK